MTQQLLKIATINISGNVGKTTIAQNLLYPRLAGAQLFEVESVNTGMQIKAAKINTLRASSYGAMVDKIMVADSAIVDVGASNVEAFLKEMQELDGSHEELDAFLIPCIKDEKIIKETIKTAVVLSGLGVPAEKIKVVFNRFPKDADIEVTFAPIFKRARDGSLFASSDAVIYENPIYSELSKMAISLRELNDDQTDYRAKLKDCSEKEQEKVLAMIANKRRAVSANTNLDAVFAALFQG